MTDDMNTRMDAIRLKQILGTPLTEQELMCLQMEQNGFGCSAALPPQATDDGPWEDEDPRHYAHRMKPGC